MKLSKSSGCRVMNIRSKKKKGKMEGGEKGQKCVEKSRVLKKKRIKHAQWYRDSKAFHSLPFQSLGKSRGGEWTENIVLPSSADYRWPEALQSCPHPLFCDLAFPSVFTYVQDFVCLFAENQICANSFMYPDNDWVGMSPKGHRSVRASISAATFDQFESVCIS